MCDELIVAVLYALGGMLPVIHVHHTYVMCEDLTILAA